MDVQNTRQQTVMTREVIDTIPTGKTAQNFAVLVPGVIAATAGSGLTAQDVGGSVGDKQVALIVHGSRSQEMPLLFDGMRYNNMNATAGGSHVIWTINTGTVQEYTVEVGALSAEADVSGVRQNVIPKAGGNVFRGSFFGELHQRYARLDVQCVEPRAGHAQRKDLGPQPDDGRPDRPRQALVLWRVPVLGERRAAAGRLLRHEPVSTNVYTPDLSRPTINENWNQSEDFRLTWQASARHKFSLWADDLQRCTCHWFAASNVSPDASAVLKTYPNLMVQATWSAPITNRFLIDAGYHVPSRVVVVVAATDVPGTRIQSWSSRRTCVPRARIVYAAPQQYRELQVQRVVRHRLARVQGRVPGDARVADDLQRGARHRDHAPPVQRRAELASEYTFPYTTKVNLKYYIGLFAQDQWTMNRMTLNLGIRLDAMNAYVPAQTYPATPLVASRSFEASRMCRTGRTSALASASPTICLATAGRRSRRTSAVSCRA